VFVAGQHASSHAGLIALDSGDILSGRVHHTAPQHALRDFLLHTLLSIWFALPTMHIMRTYANLYFLPIAGHFFAPPGEKDLQKIKHQLPQLTMRGRLRSGRQPGIPGWKGRPRSPSLVWAAALRRAKSADGMLMGTGRPSASAPGWCAVPISARVPISAWSGCRRRRRHSRSLRFLWQHSPDRMPSARRPTARLPCMPQ
jgi:hypothetical protein